MSVFALACAAMLAWTIRVLSPLDAVYSAIHPEAACVVTDACVPFAITLPASFPTANLVVAVVPQNH